MSVKESDSMYALKCIFNAHTADVRVVKPTLIPDGGILTGSRDSTVKVWSPDGKLFKQCNIFKGTSAFISSLCVLPPSDQYPQGLFLAGSNDCSIYGFTPDSSEPVLRLLGHSSTVCSLQYKDGIIVSASWDKTVRLWSGQRCVEILQGHLQAVWATDVFERQRLILTGSADRTIRLWRAGKTERVFTGHEDCVRGLAVTSPTTFLSCSNDTTVRSWCTSGECLQIFRNHTDYIYSLSLLDNGIDFVTCGEDQNIKIYKNGTCVQTFVIAPKSLWSVACLQNGDLVVGTSDGKVYVFEKVPLDYFENMSDKCELAGEASKLNINDKVELVKDDLSTISSIYDGEKIVTYGNEPSSMYVCKYDHIVGTTEVQKKPFDIGFITETFSMKTAEEVAPPNLPSKKKDYVFDVDVENMFYKLEFNKDENPWDVASKFVAEHNLPTDHVGQIVDFILKNTGSSFANEFYPAKSYLTYLNINIAGLRAKLLEFCALVPKEKCISESEVDEMLLLAHFPDNVSLSQMSSLDKVLSWSDDYLFPVLDLLRLGVRGTALQPKISKEFVNHLLSIFKNTMNNVNRILITKIFCNMFGFNEAENVLLVFQDKIFEAVKERFSTGDLSIQKSGAALFFNFAVASYKGFNLNSNVYCLNVIEILTHVVDADAVYRMLVAIGTVCTRDSLAVVFFKSVEIKEFILKFNGKYDDIKINKVLSLLHKDF